MRSVTRMRNGTPMNKAELIEAIAAETQMSKAESARVLNVVLDTIVNTVASKGDIQLVGFGNFKAVQRAARIGQNPRNGDKVKIPAAVAPKFSAGVAFKNAVNPQG